MLYPEHEGKVVGAAIVMLAILFVALTQCCGCAPRTAQLRIINQTELVKSADDDKKLVSKQVPLQVEITNRKPTCYLTSIPEPPKELSLLMEETDVVRRVFVHIRDYNELVIWTNEITQWMGVVQECIQNELTSY